MMKMDIPNLSGRVSAVPEAAATFIHPQMLFCVMDLRTTASFEVSVLLMIHYLQ